MPVCGRPGQAGDRFCGHCGTSHRPAQRVAVVLPVTESRTEGHETNAPTGALGPAPKPQPFATTRPATESRPTAEPRPTPGARAALGTLAVLGRVFRLFNGALTVVSGIVIAVIAHSDPAVGHDSTWFVLGGITWALYGLYIAFGHGSYWVSSTFTYLIPIAVLIYWNAGQHLHH